MGELFAMQVMARRFITSILQDIWKIRVQLTKPVTWPPLVWGVVCGAAASGHPLCIDAELWHKVNTILYRLFFSNLSIPL